MDLPASKNRSWIAQLHQSIDQLPPDLKSAVMKPAGEACASDLIALCKTYLDREVTSLEDLIDGWNMVREKRNLQGRWEIEGNTARAIFNECGCPLVRSGLIELHPVQCYCSQGMMETIFSRVAGKVVKAELRRTIGRGDKVCEFVISL